jgi:hypothetical protein
MHSGNRFTGNCRICGMYGHKACDCKNKEKADNIESSENAGKKENKDSKICTFCNFKGPTMEEFSKGEEYRKKIIKEQ